MDHRENYPFFQQNRNMTTKHHTRNQPNYSEDGEFFSQNQQRFSTNQQKNYWNNDPPGPIYQPALFEPYTRNEQTRRTRHNPTSYRNKFQSKKPINTQKYQPTQLPNEILLPYYLQHKLKKTQLTNFLKYKCRRITTDDYESIPYGWIFYFFI